MAIQDAESRLREFQIFEAISDEDLLSIGQLVEEKSVRAGEILFRQGDVPDSFYLIESGMIEEIGKDQAGTDALRRQAEKGSFVGRWSLINGKPRRATATVMKSADLLQISARDFLSLLAVFPGIKDKLERVDVVSRLLAIPLFRHFSEPQLYHVADLVTVCEFSAEQPDPTIYRRGDVPDGFYIVDTGQVLEGHQYLAAGSFFGHEDVLKKRLRQVSALAETEVRLFRIEPDAFKWLGQLQPGFRRAVLSFAIGNTLQEVSIFAKCTPEDLRYAAGYVGLARYRAGDVLFYQGEFNPTLYFLYEGAVVARSYDEQTGETSQSHLRAGKTGQTIGQAALFLEEPRDVTLQATTESLLLYLCRSDLDQLVAKRPEIEKRLAPREKVVERKKLKRFSWMQDDEHPVFQQRRHWFVLVARLAVPVSLLLVFLVLWLLRLSPEIQSSLRCIRPFVLFLSLAWVIWRFVDWTNDFYVVTDQRAVHEEKVLLIRETRDEAPLNRIQNINIDRHLIGSVLGFGKLTIDTAARAGASRVVFDYLANPRDVQALIFEQMSRVQAGAKLEVRRSIQEKLGARVSLGLKPDVPHPVIPQLAEAAAPEPKKPAWWTRIYQATLKRWFWIEKTERDQIIWRKHWIRLFAKIGLPSFAIFVWLLILGIYLNNTNTANWGFLGFWVVCLLPLTFWWWWNWENWGNDRYIVTSDRIIDIEAWPLGFRTTRNETTFNNIQNVSFEIPHPVATILNYGTVVVYTAGAEGRLDFVYVRDPKRVQSEIFERWAAYGEGQRRRQREERWADLPDWFAEYDRARHP